MDHFDQTPEELREVAERLRQGRAGWSPHELDRLKVRAIEQAAKPAGRRKPMRGAPMRARVLVLALSILIVGGTVAGGVAATSGGGSENAAEAQYGPPTCPNGERVDNNCGNGQGPGNGNGQQTCPNGKPFPNCGRSPQEQQEAQQAARKQCRDDAKSGRADLRATKKRHQRFLQNYHGAQRRRLAAQFRNDEALQNRRVSHNYKTCRERADNA
jgi:hypothetical protein